MLQPGVTIYFVRHGQTPWNAASLAQGHSDIALNDLGRAQALGNAERLAALLRQAGTDPAGLDFVSSPLVRARETMQVLRAGLGQPTTGYRVDARLKEMGFGVKEGASWPDYAQGLVEAERDHGIDPWTYAAEGGESYADLSARALPVFQEMARDTVVACHGGISRCLLVAMAVLKPAEAIIKFIPQDKIMVLRRREVSWA